MKNEGPEFSLQRRIALYLMICQDKTLDRTALHVAAVLLLKHTNRTTAKTVPGRDRIAEGMGRSTWTVTEGLRSLKVRWLRQVRRVGTSASYEWNWDEVSAEEWQGTTPTMNVGTRPQHECGDKATDSNVGSSPPIHIEEPVSFNQEVQPGSSTFREEKEPAVGNKNQESDSHSNPATLVPDFCPDTHGGDHDVTPYFEHFWAVYPRREKKEEARRAFVVAVEAGIPPQLLIDKAGDYARSCAGKEIRYIALPANWLRDKRWTDDYDAISPSKLSWSEQLAQCGLVGNKLYIDGKVVKDYSNGGY
jgi:hypothetical protein